MREILFRGKRIEDGEWVEGDFLADGFKGITWILPRGEREEDRVISETVGQYTGLCDKNGKKIFEGDVITFPWGGLGLYRFGMKWDDRSAMFHAYPVKKIADVWPIGMFGYENVMEVIGNIHDNPELLEVSHE